MGTLDAFKPSLWVGTTDETDYGSLSSDLKCDVVVAGGGMCGLTTAYLLAESGASVVLLEAGRIASGVTGYTTAKVTSLHGTIYQKIVKDHGTQAAEDYGAANQAGLELVARLVSELSIDCDFVRLPSYTFAPDTSSLEAVTKEAETAASAGLPASFVEECSLPFECAGAVRFDNQAMFHPRKYCLALATAFVANSGRLFENTRVLGLEDDGVTTEAARVTSGSVVLATHLPAKGLFFAKTHPERSYAMAVTSGVELTGTYLSAGSSSHSLRPAPVGDRNYLIVGGEGHKAGQEPDTPGCYKRLEDWARSKLDVKSVAFRWSAHDYVSVDGLPWVGESDGHYVATGFAKWGMSNASAAAIMISDSIAGRDNEWLKTFDADRSPSHGISQLIKQNANAGKELVTGALTAASDAESLQPGESGIVSIDGHRAACHRDSDGTLHAVSPACTHLGCTVSWNDAERTWDCPCHGSRFDIDGKVIEGPATADLEVIEPAEINR